MEFCFEGPFLQIGQLISVSKPLLQRLELGKPLRHGNPDHKNQHAFHRLKMNM